jgi:hypothetical protein
VKINTELAHCHNCKTGILLPKKEKHHNEWSLICEHQHSKKCRAVQLNKEYQEVFKELKKWHLNDYEIHDIVKYSRSSTQMLRAILFINNQQFSVYKNKIDALKLMSSANINYQILKYIILSRYKYKLLNKIIFLLSILLILVGIGIYRFFFTSYESEYLKITEHLTNTKPIIEETETIDPLLDSDGDSITDIDEITIYKTDPYKADTDGDGFTDKEEIDGGYDPLKKAE